MSRSLRIKAFTILIAWTVIFLHGIIPHHHEQDQGCNNTNIIHEILADNHCNEHVSIITGLPDHYEKVCHFSVLLFQQLNYDELLFNPEKKIATIHVLLIESAICEAAQIDFSEPDTDNTSLRAPPVS